MRLTLYVQDKLVFVDLGDDYLLCIGGEAELKDATPERIRKMIDEAIAINRFRYAEVQGTVH